MDLTIREDSFGVDDQSWLGSAHGTDSTIPVTLDVSAFTEATHYPDGFFKSGLPLGKLTAGGKYVPYNGAGADGSETLVGFLFSAVKAPDATTTDVSGALLTHGSVRTSRLPVSVDAAGQADLAGRFVFI